ncbi:uncharacterized protein SCHCODRAFT_02491912 [Schizophyllum commune H4-8]|nr:uncharacterized protein SCHCODRAFT_02491912 [Schizophyllum commune H4-8]KAI5897105.1 hypothetical protein SCHCODRAFT_02491912 [Schizophyllum commune H4-8]
MESLDHLLRTNRQLSDAEECSALQLLLDAQQRLGTVSNSAATNRRGDCSRLLARIDALMHILAPIRRLPLELLSIVFDFYIGMVHYGPMSVKGGIETFFWRIHEGPCLLLHVCSLWRAVCRTTASLQSFFASMVLSTPEASTYAVGGDFPRSLSQPSVKACLAHYLALFDVGPLSIVMRNGRRIPVALDTEAKRAQCAERCSQLVVHCHGSQDPLAAILWNFLGRFHQELSFLDGRLKCLESLCLGFRRAGDGYEEMLGVDIPATGLGKKVKKTRLFAHAPKLRRLRLLQDGIRLLSAANPRFALPWNQIQDFYTHYASPAECLAGLFSLPSVKTVSLLRFARHKSAYLSYHPPWPGHFISQPFRLPLMDSLTLFYLPRQLSIADEDESGCYPDFTSRYPAEVLDLLEAPLLKQLRVGFAESKTSTATVSTITAFLQRSGCGLVKLYLSLQTQDMDDDIADLLRSVASLQELTLCMHAGVTLSLGVLASLVVTPGGWNNLLPALRRFTLITDDSPDTMEFKSDPLAGVVESRVNAGQRTEGVVMNLEIFQIACQEDHPFAWCPRIKERARKWMRAGLKVATAVVDLPTQFVSSRDEGEFMVDWEWLRPE